MKILSALVVVPMVLIVSVFSFSIINSGISDLRVGFGLILVCERSLCRFFCAYAGVYIISLGERMILAPGVRQRLTLRVISIDLNSSILISVLIMGALIIVNFTVLQRDIDSDSDVVFFFGSSEDKNLSVEKKTNNLPVHE